MARAADSDFVYDLPRLLELYRLEQSLVTDESPRLHVLNDRPMMPRSLGVLAGSFNPLTRGHEALVDAALHSGVDVVMLLMPLRAVNKEAVERASVVDRLLVLQQWAADRPQVVVAIANRGLYVEQVTLLAARYPSSQIAMLVGHDKVVQILDQRYYQDRDRALQALFEHARLLVAPRHGCGAEALAALLAHTDHQPYASSIAPLDVTIDVDSLSSSAVRQCAAADEDCTLLTPPESAALIRETRPYAHVDGVPGNGAVDTYGRRMSLIAEASRTGWPNDSKTFARECRRARDERPVDRS